MKRFIEKWNPRVRRLNIIDIVMLQVGAFCLAMLVSKAIPGLRKVDYRRWLRIMMGAYARPLMVLTKK